MNDLNFPLWLRSLHFINFLLLTLLVRSGLQILADHPKLYTRDDAPTKKPWLKFTRKRMPPDKNKLWTAMDEVEPINAVAGISGGEHKLGLARNWHFFLAMLWLLTGLTYIVLIFSTGAWRHIIPTDPQFFHQSWAAIRDYATLHRPPLEFFQPYEPLQQLAYAGVVFILSPLMLITAMGMSPAFVGRFPWYLKLLGGKQGARSLHFLGMVGFLVFFAIHIIMISLVYLPRNIGEITLGNPTARFGLSLLIVLIIVGLVLILNWLITWASRKHEIRINNILRKINEPVLQFVFGRLQSRQNRADISDFMRVNGRPPTGPAWTALAKKQFAGWQLEVGGEVEQPSKFSLDDLKKLGDSTQTTLHQCIQGWSAVAEWDGVPLATLLNAVKPKPSARYVVFTSYQTPLAPSNDIEYYETLTLPEARFNQTLLAWGMNGQNLPLEHGAPLRLRAEAKLGFKMVKYLKRIELVDDLKSVGLGHGGFKEDYEGYDRVAAI